MNSTSKSCESNLGLTEVSSQNYRLTEQNLLWCSWGIFLLTSLSPWQQYPKHSFLFLSSSSLPLSSSLLLPPLDLFWEVLPAFPCRSLVPHSGQPRTRGWAATCGLLRRQGGGQGGEWTLKVIPMLLQNASLLHAVGPPGSECLRMNSFGICFLPADGSLLQQMAWSAALIIPFASWRRQYERCGLCTIE